MKLKTYTITFKQHCYITKQVKEPDLTFYITSYKKILLFITYSEIIANIHICEKEYKIYLLLKTSRCITFAEN